MAGLAGKWASGPDSSSESEALSDEGSEVSITPKTPSGMFEKDSDEEELERLVLGDKASFRENLFKNDFVLKGQDTDDVQMDDVDTGGLEDVDDADLFVVDTVAGAGNSGTIATKEPSATAPKNAQGDAPAWEDSDDDRLVVSLARNTKMRRLRLTADDDLVSGTEYSRRLRQQFLRVHPAPSWVKDASDRSASRRRRRSSAGGSGSDSDSSENEHGAASAEPLEEFLRSVKQLAGVGASKKHRLRPEVIDIQKTHNIPDKHKMPVECLSFHPEYPVLLSASTATILHLHHIAPDAQPTPNPRLTSVQIKQVDVRQAQFLYPQGDKIYFAGRRGYFHHWDLPSGIVQKTEGITGRQMEYNTMDRFKLSPCGRYMAIVATARKGSGVINILNVTTSQWIAAARLSSRNGIADFAWWSTGDGMTILGRDGQVGEYSMVSRGFVGIWNDDGCLGGIVIALGGHGGPAALGEDRWVAVGSNTGITNIYERSMLIESQTPDEVNIKDRPQPTRTFEHLITPITVVTFSPDGQLLAFGSRAKVDALKLVHLPSCTVYRNWPTQKTPLGRVTCVAFGRKSDLLAIGDDIGRIKLWHIRR